jgi:hypothetical protein
MAKIERFEDIQAWKRSRQLTNKVYNYTQQRGFEKDFGLKIRFAEHRCLQ